jgi:hypothetical protein
MAGWRRTRGPWQLTVARGGPGGLDRSPHDARDVRGSAQDQRRHRVSGTESAGLRHRGVEVVVGDLGGPGLDLGDGDRAPLDA